MLAADKGAAARNAFGLETDRLIGAAGAQSVWKQAERKPMRQRLGKDALDHAAQQRRTKTLAGLGNGDPLQKRRPFRRIPVAQQREADRFRCSPDEIGIARLGHRLAVLFWLPSTDKAIETRPPLGRDDERDVAFRGADNFDMGHRHRLRQGETGSNAAQGDRG